MHIKADTKHITALSNRLVNGIMARTPSVTQNGDPSAVYPGCVNLSFAYVEGESLLMALKDIALSSGSACTSASLEPSYVLRALGADDEMAHSSIRFGIGRFTTEKEIDFLIDKVATQVARLREMSPLWEMVRFSALLFTFDSKLTYATLNRSKKESISRALTGPSIKKMDESIWQIAHDVFTGRKGHCSGRTTNDERMKISASFVHFLRSF